MQCTRPLHTVTPAQRCSPAAAAAAHCDCAAQEAEPGEADDWEAVPLGEGGSNGAAAAAAAGDGDAAGDDAEDEDWEDV